eukprot:TRINITY_DN32241_c0_g1_i1.p1 TRINITY_DN32241_c0_g1~~TRINITY_DN32241_c0_g1_i1.p1  ORF type:complete len:141 (+),score=32.77 TRINITY_DN32241_c0_g1_i1:92-514(+)
MGSQQSACCSDNGDEAIKENVIVQAIMESESSQGGVMVANGGSAKTEEAPEPSVSEQLAGFWTRKKDQKRLGNIVDDEILWESNFKEKRSRLSWIDDGNGSKLQMILGGATYVGQVSFEAGTAFITWEDGDSWVRQVPAS